MKVMSDYPKEVIEKIKEIDLLTYLENYEPYELVKINERMYSTREHDSLKISNGLWCWWSRGIGGKNALKFLTVVRGMSYEDAVELLVNKTAIAPPVYSKPIKFEKAKKLILPDRAIDNSRLSRYLQWNRGIDEEIVEYCIKNDLIFEGLFTSKKSGKTFRNAIFVGYGPRSFFIHVADGHRIRKQMLRIDGGMCLAPGSGTYDAHSNLFHFHDYSSSFLSIIVSLLRQSFRPPDASEAPGTI